MSYILDALRRAESERAREKTRVPGLHSQSMVEPDTDVSPTPGGVPWRWVALSLGGGVVLSVVVWWMLSGSAPAADDAPTRGGSDAGTPNGPALAAHRTVPSTPEAGGSAAASSVVMAPIKDQLVLPPAPPAPPPIAQAPSNPGAEAPARPAKNPGAAAAPGLNPGLPPPTRTEPMARSPEPAAPTPGGSASSPAASGILSLEQLPPEIRRELPSLQVGGSVYSEDPSSRLLILNGQLFHERDQIQTGLTIEQIRPKSAVLNFKGYRYQIAY